tara:strand:- start:236 stop:517 length:282 start_codon:yes stop_codon:yes gene_type:complete
VAVRVELETIQVALLLDQEMQVVQVVVQVVEEQDLQVEQETLLQSRLLKETQVVDQDHLQAHHTIVVLVVEVELVQPVIQVPLVMKVEQAELI